MSGMVVLFSLLITLPTYSQTRAIQIDAIAHITQLPSLNYSSGFLQQAIALYGDDANSYALQSKPLSKREFVYVH
jgi:hypothetical protein